MREMTQILRQTCISILSLFRSSITVAVLVVFCCTLTGGLAAYQNDWDYLLHVVVKNHQRNSSLSICSIFGSRVPR